MVTCKLEKEGFWKLCYTLLHIKEKLIYFHLRLAFEINVIYVKWHNSNKMKVYTDLTFSFTVQKNEVFHYGFLQEMWPNPQETVDLITFTEETLNGKLHFCVVIHSIIIFNTIKQNTNIFSQRHKFLTINLVNIELNVLKRNNKDNRITSIDVVLVSLSLILNIPCWHLLVESQ